MHSILCNFFLLKSLHYLCGVLSHCHIISQNNDSSTICLISVLHPMWNSLLYVSFIHLRSLKENMNSFYLEIILI